mgnify:CR=1 FL=1
MDSINGLVWIDKQKPTGKGSKKLAPYYYGKDAKRLKSQRMLRKYAYVLAKKYNLPIFDKYYRIFIKVKPNKKNKYSSRKFRSL